MVAEAWAAPVAEVLAVAPPEWVALAEAAAEPAAQATKPFKRMGLNRRVQALFISVLL